MEGKDFVYLSRAVSIIDPYETYRKGLQYCREIRWTDESSLTELFSLNSKMQEIIRILYLSIVIK